MNRSKKKRSEAKEAVCHGQKKGTAIQEDRAGARVFSTSRILSPNDGVSSPAGFDL